MVGYALSGFVDGFFRGREMKNSWDDRKLDRERQTSLDKMAKERHGAIMAKYGREAADWDRANRLLEAELGVLGRAADAASAGVQTAGGAAKDARDGFVSPKSPPMSIGAVPAGTPLRGEAVPNEALARGMNDIDYGQGRVDPRLARAVGLGVVRPNQETGVAPQASPESGLVRRLADGTIVAPAPSAAIADELYQQGPVGARFISPDRQVQPSTPPSLDNPRAAIEAQIREAAAAEIERRRRESQPNYSHQFLQPGGLGADIAEIGRRVPRALGGVAEQAANAVNAVVNPYVRYATGYEFPTTSGAPRASGPVPAAAQPAEAGLASPSAAPATAPQLDPANPVPPMRAAVPPDATPKEAQAAAGAAAAVNETVPAPSADAARAAAASLGVDPGDKVTSAQYERASQSFMDRYLEVGAPMVIEHYLRTGQTEKAQRFMEFIDTAQTRQNMKDWGVAAAAIAVGNVDKAANTIVGAMKRMDYFDEGTELVRDKSGVMRDKDGNATGVRLVFKDTKSGTTFEQIYENMEDAIALGMSLMDPMTAFEQMQERAAAQREASLGLQEKALKAQSEAEKWIGSRYSEILEASKQLDGTFAKTSEQAMREAMDAYRLLQRGLSGKDEPETAPVDPNRDPNTNYRE